MRNIKLLITIIVMGLLFIPLQSRAAPDDYLENESSTYRHDISREATNEALKAKEERFKIYEAELRRDNPATSVNASLCSHASSYETFISSLANSNVPEATSSGSSSGSISTVAAGSSSIISSGSGAGGAITGASGVPRGGGGPSEPSSGGSTAAGTGSTSTSSGPVTTIPATSQPTTTTKTTTTTSTSTKTTIINLESE